MEFSSNLWSAEEDLNKIMNLLGLRKLPDKLFS